MPAGLAVPAPPASHETILDRHHLLYGTVIPNPTEAPYGTPGELYVCLSCHAIDTSSGINQFLIERDCRACHQSDRHHILYNTVIPNPTDAPFGTPGESYVCLSCHAIDTSSGINQFLIERDCRVCHHPTGVQTVVVDVKPGSNQNVFNPKSRGVLPVSILGSNDYDVTEIDVSTLLLEGQAAPLRSRLQKRADGTMDLKLKFSSEAVHNAFGNLQLGQTYDVWITGKFTDGTRIMGSDYFVAAPLSWGKWFSGAMKNGPKLLPRPAQQPVGERKRVSRERH